MPGWERIHQDKVTIYPVEGGFAVEHLVMDTIEASFIVSGSLYETVSKAKRRFPLLPIVILSQKIEE